MSDREIDEMIVQLFRLLTDEEKEEVVEHIKTAKDPG